MATVTTIHIFNPEDESQCISLELPVNITTAHTWIRARKLELVDIKPVEKSIFTTVEGKPVERYAGKAIIECLGARATVTVVFAEKEDAEVLGFLTIAELGFELDPVTRQLRKVKATPTT